MFQYSLVAVIVLIILIWQYLSYKKNKSMINQLEDLFPKVDDLIIEEESARHIECTNPSSDLKETLSDINAYLAENRNRTPDYNIIKEIVERNSHKLEEEVDTVLSIPLYLGLMATISGAAIGIGFFAWTDLEGLLSGTTIQSSGIKNLLTDIGIAMFASFFGVLWTALSTSAYKEAKGKMLKRKNAFLTWIQTKVMPNVADDLSGVLSKMAQDLNYFNCTFAENTLELKQTLAQVTDNYKNQVDLLDAIDKIKINRIAQANIEVYDKLRGCTDIIERLFDHLGNSEHYISRVVELNSKLGDIEERTKLSEELGKYFKSEIEYVQDRQGMIRQQLSSIDSVFREAFENLSSSLSNSISNLTEVFQKQNQQVQELIEEQQNALSEALNAQRAKINNKIEEFNDPFSGIKDIYKEIWEQSNKGINRISETFENQNIAVQEMLSAQLKLLEKELSDQREVVIQQYSFIPDQMTDLTSTINKLNKVIEMQYDRIDLQTKTLEQLSAVLGGNKYNHESKWKKRIMLVCVCGSFFLLLALLLVQLFSINI